MTNNRIFAGKIFATSRNELWMVDQSTGQPTSSQVTNIDPIAGTITYIATIEAWNNRLFHFANNTVAEDGSTYSISELNEDGSIMQVHAMEENISQNKLHEVVTLGDSILAIGGCVGETALKETWIKIR